MEKNGPVEKIKDMFSNPHTSHKKTTIWNFFYLNLRSIISITNGILIVPLYLHYINGTLYGAWLATGNIMMWLTIADPGVGDVLLQKIGNALAKDDRKEIGLAIASGSVISIIVFTAILALGLGGSYYVGEIINYTEKDAHALIICFQIALIGTCLSLLANTTNNILLGFQKTKEFGFYSTMITLLSMAVTILLLVLDYGLYAIAYTYLIRGAVLIIYSVTHCYQVLHKYKIPYQLSRKYTGGLFKIFIYTFGGKVFTAVSGNIDLIIISRFIGPQSVTILELSRRPIRIVTGFSNNISISALPAFSHLSGTDRKDRIKKIIMDTLILILWYSTFIIGGFLLFSQSLISHWVGIGNYFGNLNNTISCAAFFLLSITYSISNIVYTFGDIKKNNIIAIVRNLFYIVIVAFAVKYMGIRGELIAFLLSIIVLNCTYYPKRLIKIAGLNAGDISQFLKELSPAVLLLATCCLVSILYNGSFSLANLTFFASIYVIGFLFYAGLFSNRFKLFLTDKWFTRSQQQL